MKRFTFAILLTAVACNRGEDVQTAATQTAKTQAAKPPIGNAQRGKDLVAQYGCNVCHTVPGIEGPQGSLAPTMAGMATRPTIANGQVPKTPENVASYIENPALLYPQSTMPALGISSEEASDMAAYLLTLE